MLVYNIGISAVQANQAALQAISNNIANANTEGYHRQQVRLSQTNPIVRNQIQFGTGVQVSSVHRAVNTSADHALVLNLSQSADSEARLEALRVIEGLLTPATGSLADAVSTYFNNVEKLATNPSDNTFRSQVIYSAEAVARQITSLHSGLDQLQQEQANRVFESVAKINQLTSEIAALNQQIKLAQAQGFEPNTILDQRDQLIQELGKEVDISPGSLLNGDGTLVAAGGWLVVGDVPQKLSVERGPDGTLQIMIGSRGPVQPVGGRLAGHLAAHNEIIPEVRDSIISWTSAFVSGVNSAQATGLGLQGPLPHAHALNAVLNTTAPLSQAGTLFPIGEGSLFISVTNSQTGERTTHEIAVNPSVDSLQDIVSRLNGLSHVNASISSGGHLQITAAHGFLIDFAGRPDSSVDFSGVSGTAVPTIVGIFNGLANHNWVISAESSGQVGVTDGLRLRVTDADTGQLITTLNVGSGYLPGQPITIADGLSIQLDPGTLVSGDSFSVQAIGDPDSSGILSALGIGGLFQTFDLRTITINKSISEDPTLLAASRTGGTGDASQLQRIIRFRDAGILSSGTETVEQRLASITSNSGLAVNSFETQLSQLQSQYDQIRNQQDSVSGVDPNEELLAMLQYQRAFQANARFISTINSALDELLGILN
jgi:flagellar hook-associated protein FlgK